MPEKSCGFTLLCRCVLNAGLLLCLAGSGVYAATDPGGGMQGGAGLHEHDHQHMAKPTVTDVGIDERLGVRLPLDLTFRDEQGELVRLGDLIDKPTVIAPIYYRCPNVCSFLQGDMARVLPQLPLIAGSDYRVLSVSFDETETPELARRSRDTYYAAMSKPIPEGGWRFLTGDTMAIHGLFDAAGFHFLRSGSDFVHPVTLIVVTADGRIVRYLEGTHILPKDLTLALYEARQGHVGTTIRKVVQYCFSYDPEQKTYVFNLLRVSATVILVTLGAFLAFLILGGKKRKKVSRND